MIYIITYVNGDIFNSPAQVIVNTVNLVGVMGKGIALTYKERYPEMFDAYKSECDKHTLSIGKLMFWKAPDHIILLFPTKIHWRNPSKLEYIEKGLQQFIREYKEEKIISVAFPKLGCGNGGLNWADVKRTMENYLGDLPIKVYVYLANDVEQFSSHKKAKNMSQYLKDDAKDFSFNAIKDELYYETAMLPYRFLYKGKYYSASYDGSLTVKCESEEQSIIICEETFQSIWEEARFAGMFECSGDTDKQMIYALMCSLNYLSPVKLLNDANGKTVDGYQVNEGFNRVYMTMVNKHEL